MTISLWILLTLSIIFASIAQYKVVSTIKHYHNHRSSSGLTGKQIAEFILEKNSLESVPVKSGRGHLSDHYNPIKRHISLSPAIYSDKSLSSLSVSAHEVGHALQHKANFIFLHIRSLMYPIVSFSSKAAPFLIMFGFVFQALNLVKVGILFFSASVLFSIVTLPVEFDASRRALAQIKELNLASNDELLHVRKILTAAALTYVAAALVSVVELLRYISIVRSND